MNGAGASRFLPSSPFLRAQRTPDGQADHLAKIKQQLDECVKAHPWGLVSVATKAKEGPQAQYKIEKKTPLEQIVVLARDEHFLRSDQEQGYNAHLHEPVYAVQAMEDALKKGVPVRILTPPHSILEAASQAYSHRLFSLLLDYGVKPDTQDIRNKLRKLWKDYVAGAHQYLSYITKYQRYQQSCNPESDALEIMPGLEPSFTREGLLAAGEGALFNLKRMDLSVRAYAKAQAFINKLRNRVAESRQNKFLAELEAEAAEPKKTSKSAKRKARQKALREQKVVQPPSLKESAASGTGVNTDILPVRSISPSGETAHLGSPSSIRPDDAVIRELRDKVQRLLPTQTDRDEFRSRVQSLKNRIERAGERFEEIRRFWEES